MVCPWCVLSAEIEELFRNVHSQLTVILFVDSKSINNGSLLYFVSFFHVFPGHFYLLLFTKSAQNGLEIWKEKKEL